jgi:chemotaxis protein CheX
MLEAMVIEATKAAAVNVFSTMLGKDLDCGPHQEGENDAASNGGVVAQISLVGASSITSLVCCSAEVACAIAAAMLMQECAVVDAEVLDAMAEMANMIMGNVKTDLEAHLGGGVNLSIPTVTYGQSFIVHNHNKRWIVVPFRMDEGLLTVQLCLEAAAETRLGKRALKPA